MHVKPPMKRGNFKQAMNIKEAMMLRCFIVSGLERPTLWPRYCSMNNLSPSWHPYLLKKVFFYLYTLQEFLYRMISLTFPTTHFLPSF